MSAQELDRLWSQITDRLRSSAGTLASHVWINSLELVSHERGVLYVRAPRHIRTLVAERYVPLLRAAGERVLEAPTSVVVVGEEWVAPTAAATAETGTSARPLNPRYSFDQFVIGDGNRLAHAAALTVAEQPGQAYNPLFLHGLPGLGKTHLLHAVGNYVLAYGAGLSVHYASSEDFTSAYVRSVRAGDVDSFKATIRSADVLLLDDVQFLAERTRTREELFHTFNSLYETGCQLVVSSDRAPGALTAFERRLADRFASGLVAELHAPSLSVRAAILRKRVSLDDLPPIDDATLVEVARHTPSSVRALEGALVRLVAQASLSGQEPTPELVRTVLGGAARESKVCSLSDIQRATAADFGLSHEALLAHDRRPHVAFARQVAMYLARELTDHSLPAIGAGFGGRNHSTVLHAHRRVVQQLDGDAAAARRIGRLRELLACGDADRSDCDD